MVKRIIKFPNPSLRLKCRDVSFPITPALSEHIQALRDTLVATPHGVALASNQITTEGHRVFVCRSDLLVPAVKIMSPRKDGLTHMPEVVINPTWEVYPSHAIDDMLGQNLMRGHLDFVEGCLSVPEFSGEVRRPMWAEMHYWEPDGTECVFVGVGLAARIIQHECDHLDGKLIVDFLDERQRIFIRNQAIKNRKAGK